MRSVRFLAIAVLIAPALAGCFGAEGASTSNFSLAPQRVGWYASEEAHFVLAISSSFFRSDPAFTVDRQFAIEEIRFKEKGLTFGGDFETRNPDDVKLRLSRDNRTADAFEMSLANATLDVHVVISEELRDSSYTLALKLFEVGWVESGTFRVDKR